MKSILKKILVIIIILIFIVAFSSSYKALNIDELAFVVALGIDVSDSKELKITFQFVNPPSTSEGSNQESKIVEDSVDCNSIVSAINIMNSYLARKVDLSHCRLIVFSEEVAKNGISDYIYTLMNDIQVRPSSNIIISKCDADLYIKNSVPSLETSITRYYDIFTDSSQYTGYTVDATISNFFNSLICNYCQPYAILGGITSSSDSTVQTTSINDSDIKAGSSTISGTRDSENIGMAVFNEGNLVGELDAIESVCFHILKNDIDSFLVSVPNPEQTDTNVDISLNPESLKIDIEIVNGSPYIKIDCSFSGEISSIKERTSYLDSSVLSSISSSCNNYLESILSQYLYKTSTEFKSDVNGLGKYVLSEFLTDEDFINYNWNSNYINSTFNINVDTNIDSGFLVTQS